MNYDTQKSEKQRVDSELEVGLMNSHRDNNSIHTIP